MKVKIDGKSTALTVPAPTSYEVGYGKPPVHSRFRKGRSGNPKGWPKGAKQKRYPAHAERLKEIILEEAYRMIGVRDGLREVKVPMAQAIVRAQAVNAVKGQQRAQRLFTELLVMIEQEKRREHREVFEAVVDYKGKWDRELEGRRALGIAAADPLPHPDQIRVDFRTGTHEIVGPWTKEEQADLEVWKRCKVFFEDVNAWHQYSLDFDLNDRPRAYYEEEIAANRQFLALIAQVLEKGLPIKPPSLDELPEEWRP